MRAHESAHGAVPGRRRRRELARSSGNLTYDEVLRLQRTIGNRAVARRVLARAGGTSTATGSSCKGLKKEVAWSDYTGSRPTSSGGLAYTYATATVRFSGGPANTPTEEAFELVDDGFRLRNEVVTKVTMNASKSWKRLTGLTDKQKQLLREHEQGHYDIVALFARDMFIELMKLKNKRFTTAGMGVAAAKKIVDHYKALAEKVSEIYDESGETDHQAFYDDHKPDAQERWDKMFAAAKARTEDPDEQPLLVNLYKTRFLDVLEARGYSSRVQVD